MYELISAGADTYYMDCPSRVGYWVREGGDVFLIDSGNSRDAGKKALKLVDGKGWRVAGILNTHSHADHIGGNRLIQERTGCAVFSGGIEGAFVRAPILEPISIYAGYPHKELRHKFLVAQESDAREFTDPAFPAEIEVVPLEGHSFEMAGFRTPDDVLFVGDAISSETMLTKYVVSFIYDVAAYLKTLDRLEGMSAARFVPSHAEVTDDIAPLVRLNRDCVYSIAEKLLDICREPRCFDDLLSRVFTEYDLKMDYFQHSLVGCTIRSYMSWLFDLGRAEAVIEDNRLLWHAV